MKQDNDKFEQFVFTVAFIGGTAFGVLATLLFIKMVLRLL
jgi:hypothetical protein